MTAEGDSPWSSWISAPLGAELPLEGLRVIDFSTLLPGPLATYFLMSAGARVIKVERPEGDGLRDRPIDFGMLNSGKHSVVIDLKDPEARAQLWPLVEGADVLVEQFRPGVLERLGFGYEEVHGRNPDLVYCSITGYGQTGLRSTVAGHDLNYLATSGMLGLLQGGDRVGDALPPGLIADVGAGTYPALLNILLALMGRHSGSPGRHLDIAMADNVFPFMYWALARDQRAFEPGKDRLTGGSPRYNTYPTSDARTLAVAALEPNFWIKFCDAIGLMPEYRDDQADAVSVTAAVAAIVGTKTGTEWEHILGPADCCCTIVRTPSEAITDSAYVQRAVFAEGAGQEPLTSVPIPLDRSLRREPTSPAPQIGDSVPSPNLWTEPT